MKRGRWSSPGSHLLISFECPTVYSPSFLMVMRTSILAVFFERHSRWIRSDVLSIRRAEKEWMAGRLPVQSLRVSTSSLACFCHKLLFGRGLICPSSPCSELCRPSSNLQHQAQDACTNSTLPQVRATQDTGGGCVFFCACVSFISPHQETLWESARQARAYSGVPTSVASSQSPYTLVQLAKDSGFTIWRLNSLL